MKEQLNNNFESEKFCKVELQIISPFGDKGYMVAYEGNTESLCRAYDFAITKILDDAGLKPFFQIGSNQKTGYRAFECWIARNRETENIIKSLFPKIHDLAKKEFEGIK